MYVFCPTPKIRALIAFIIEWYLEITLYYLGVFIEAVSSLFLDLFSRQRRESHVYSINMYTDIFVISFHLSVCIFNITYVYIHIFFHCTGT